MITLYRTYVDLSVNTCGETVTHKTYNFASLEEMKGYLIGVCGYNEEEITADYQPIELSWIDGDGEWFDHWGSVIILSSKST